MLEKDEGPTPHATSLFELLEKSNILGLYWSHYSCFDYKLEAKFKKDMATQDTRMRPRLALSLTIKMSQYYFFSFSDQNMVLKIIFAVYCTQVHRA